MFSFARLNDAAFDFVPSAQDIRLWRVGSGKESVECNNEKLVSGSSTAYIRSAKQFLQSTVFQHGHPMPTVIAAPSFLRSGDDSPEMTVDVC